MAERERFVMFEAEDKEGGGSGVLINPRHVSSVSWVRHFKCYAITDTSGNYHCVKGSLKEIKEKLEGYGG